MKTAKSSYSTTLELFDEVAKITVYPRKIDLLHYHELFSTHVITNPTMMPVVARVTGTGQAKLFCDKTYFSLGPGEETQIRISRLSNTPPKSLRVSIGLLPAAILGNSLNLTWRDSPQVLFSFGIPAYEIKIRFRGEVPWSDELDDLHEPFTIPRDFGEFLNKHRLTNGTEPESLSMHEANILSTALSLDFESTLPVYNKRLPDGPFPFPIGARNSFADCEEMQEEQEREHNKHSLEPVA